MSDRVHELIETLREKMILLKDECAVHRSKNDDLSTENEKLKIDLQEKSSEISNLNQQMGSLKKEHEAAIGQSVNLEKEAVASEHQIDELVREIEYCIGQLKK